jgi:hypothetical protein
VADTGGVVSAGSDGHHVADVDVHAPPSLGAPPRRAGTAVLPNNASGALHRG